MPNDCFDVWLYDIQKLKQFFSKFSETHPFFINYKVHSRYFEEYFSSDRGLGAQTVVVEKDYVDRDFLLDFGGYYARCFRDYRRHCARLHFFTIKFSEEEFLSCIKGDNAALRAELESDKSENYLGFIVVKPVPKTFVGRTCLKTYSELGTGRIFPNTRNYEVHLFGLDLNVKTLAFQEQDQVVSACATSALWSAFQGTGKLFHHSIPPPIEITKAAYSVESEFEPRAMPNRGLSAVQLFHAIREVTLEPFKVDAEEVQVLKGTVYGYLKAGIPLLLVYTIYDNRKCPAEWLGYHVGTVTGYNLGLLDAEPNAATGFLLKASRINKFYVHDDQIGPFARMVFDGTDVSVVEDGTLKATFSLSSSWPGKDGVPEVGRAVPDILVVPLYQTIRLPFEKIHDIILNFDALLRVIRLAGYYFIPSDIEWDVYLIAMNDFKKEIIDDLTISRELKEKVLLKCMPRFLWRALAKNKSDGSKLADFLFDSTEIEQGKLCHRIINYNQDFWNLLVDMSGSQELEELIQDEYPRLLGVLNQVKDQANE